MVQNNTLKKLIDTISATDIKSIQKSFANHLTCSLSKDTYSATKLDIYKALPIPFVTVSWNAGLPHNDPILTMT
ncbi:hypothetical protein [Candidatus Kuenenia stuttgartiensis]|uniref:Strongly similar to glycogen phosphorylase n=1 Tax=Kuenenia stuttgartiensis TaxID=174633 RepID=A0A2C9CL01_KUEST|nr:hypothetical protein [Candidatus Kuenenia stuttgartiensis]SOH06424.1 strongly similar to glycogen phosphorylase [Candidatus Kuenenia stuttgartiensis]